MSLSVGSLEGTAWGSAVSSTDSTPDGFCSQKLWKLIFLALEPWAEGLGVELLALEISLPNFYPPLMGMGPAHSVSAPVTSLVSLIL